MPDSPKCPECYGQTYKVAGIASFKCNGCKKMWHKDSFKPEDFLWKDKPALSSLSRLAKSKKAKKNK